jgi:hypothetical protein
MFPFGSAPKLYNEDPRPAGIMNQEIEIKHLEASDRDPASRRK